MQKEKINKQSSVQNDGQYTYKYTFCCSMCGYIVKEVTIHKMNPFMNCESKCPNGCNGTIEMKCEVIEIPKMKYSKDNPYKS